MSLEFGLFLVRQNALTAEQFVELLEAHLARPRGLIGRALALNLLTVRQAAQRLDASVEERGSAGTRERAGFTQAELRQLLPAEHEVGRGLEQTIAQLGLLPAGALAVFRRLYAPSAPRPAEPECPPPKFARQRQKGEGRSLQVAAER